MNKTKPVFISNQQLRLMLENAHDGFVIHDSKGNILDVNRVAYERLGYSREEILSLTIFDIESGLDRSTLINKIWPSLNHGDSTFKQGTHKRKDCSEFPVDLTITCIKEKNESLFFALVRDATETEGIKMVISGGVVTPPERHEDAPRLSPQQTEPEVLAHKAE